MVFKLSATKGILELLQTFEPMPRDLVTAMRHKRAQVPIQQDSYSCGWRVIVNAMRRVKYLYMNIEGHIYVSIIQWKKILRNYHIVLNVKNVENTCD